MLNRIFGGDTAWTWDIRGASGQQLLGSGQGFFYHLIGTRYASVGILLKVSRFRLQGKVPALEYEVGYAVTLNSSTQLSGRITKKARSVKWEVDSAGQ